jgi:hypothetical protein
MEKISVNLLYDTKKKNTTEADTIYCECADKCTLYKSGKCLCVRTSMTKYECPHGRRETAKCSRMSDKYEAFLNKYKEDEVFDKVKRINCLSSYDYVAVLDDTLWIYFEEVTVSKYKEGETDPLNYICEGYVIGETFSLNPREFYQEKIEDVSVDLLAKAFSYVPTTFTGKDIKHYRETTVPNIVSGLREKAPEVYERLIAKYPKYADCEPDRVGCWAYVSTMTEGSVLVDGSNNQFTLKDGKLTCESYPVYLGFINAHTSPAISVDVDDKMTYKITDNSQWDENTRFL